VLHEFLSANRAAIIARTRTKVVHVDRQLLAAAAANLLQNAFKFSHPNAHILLRTATTEDRVSIEVEDECGGLPPGRAKELFQRSRPFCG
jgi:K+-sensing histidine kinase KdpD